MFPWPTRERSWGRCVSSSGRCSYYPPGVPRCSLAARIPQNNHLRAAVLEIDGLSWSVATSARRAGEMPECLTRAVWRAAAAFGRSVARPAESRIVPSQARPSRLETTGIRTGTQHRRTPSKRPRCEKVEYSFLYRCNLQILQVSGCRAVGLRYFRFYLQNRYILQRARQDSNLRPAD